jgi:hypothetical protein
MVCAFSQRCVPQANGDFLILRAVRESGGFAIAVSDDAIVAALDEAAREEGFLMCPEGAATYAAYKQSLADGRVKRTEQARAYSFVLVILRNRLARGARRLLTELAGVSMPPVGDDPLARRRRAAPQQHHHQQSCLNRGACRTPPPSSRRQRRAPSRARARNWRHKD